MLFSIMQGGGEKMLSKKLCIDCDEISCTSPCKMVEEVIAEDIDYKMTVASGGATPVVGPDFLKETELTKIIGKYGHIFKNRSSKAYFISYFKCDTLENIAKLARCTEQNLHKKYVVWMKNLGVVISKGKYKGKEVVSPKQFKDSLIFYKEEGEL
jgi:hypothetical protein